MMGQSAGAQAAAQAAAANSGSYGRSAAGNLPGLPTAMQSPQSLLNTQPPNHLYQAFQLTAHGRGVPGPGPTSQLYPYGAQSVLLSSSGLSSAGSGATNATDMFGNAQSQFRLQGGSQAAAAA